MARQNRGRVLVAYIGRPYARGGACRVTTGPRVLCRVFPALQPNDGRGGARRAGGHRLPPWGESPRRVMWLSQRRARHLLPPPGRQSTPNASPPGCRGWPCRTRWSSPKQRAGRSVGCSILPIWARKRSRQDAGSGIVQAPEPFVGKPHCRWEQSRRPFIMSPSQRGEVAPRATTGNHLRSNNQSVP